jgi:hypothetical protein
LAFWLERSVGTLATWVRILGKDGLYVIFGYTPSTMSIFVYGYVRYLKAIIILLFLPDE